MTNGMAGTVHVHLLYCTYSYFVHCTSVEERGRKGRGGRKDALIGRRMGRLDRESGSSGQDTARGIEDFCDGGYKAES
jgi:hypothetical protein